MNIGSRLKQILEERKMNVNQLAREAGVPAQTLYAMISRDSNKANMDIIARLLHALDMDFMDFMGQEWKKEAGQWDVKEQESEEEETQSGSRYGKHEIEDYLL